ncbi:MAG TPA: riboflavin kinase [Candidatus Paceibacterota bacterium]|jgi:FAD synthase|nr:riboflavin kinase [Candidatus Paceibacterota bacterium]
MEFEIEGKVIEGDKYGRKLGFPTANLDTKLSDFVSGIYGGRGIIGKKMYRAAIVINDKGRVEAHLLGYRGDAYGKILTLKLKKILRDYIKFKTKEELIKQIEKDLKMC